MGPLRRTRSTVALLAAAVALGLAAAVALAGVTVYKNNFSSSAEAQGAPPFARQALREAMEGQGQERAGAAQRGDPASAATGRRSRVTAAGPDHDFRAKQKLLKATPKGLRGSAYVSHRRALGQGLGL